VSAARLAAIVEFSDDAIISKDLDGIITSWNKGAEKLFGYTAEEAIGQSVTLLMPPDRKSEEESVLQRIRRGESIAHYETVRQMKDGRLIDIALTVSPIISDRGEVVGASKIARDITDRIRSEQALIVSEARFRTALGILTSIVWTNDASGKMTGLQPGWAQFTGQTQAEYQGYGWATAIHPEDSQQTIEAWDQAVAAKGRFEFEHRVRHHDGEWRWCKVRAVPVVNHDGSIREWVGVHHDITERRQANLDVAFLASISEDMLRLAGMEALMRSMGGKLGEHLGLSRCVFADVDDQAGTAEVIHDWIRDGGPTLRGLYPLDGHLAPDFNRAALAGEPLVVHDTATDPRCDPAKLASLKVGSFISLPFVRHERLSFLLSIHRTEAREWRDDEVDLMREVAARFWARLERSRAEDALARAMAESEQQRRLYHTMLSNTPDFIYVFDLNHRFSYINDSLLKVYGMTWEEAKGKDWIGLGYEPWHAEMHDREIDQVIATKAPIRGEIPFTGTAGRRIYDYIFSPVFDRNGEVEAIAGTTRDITERKRAESAQAAERKVFERIATGGSLEEILDTLLRETEDQSDSGMRCSILLLDKTGTKLRNGAAPSLPPAFNKAMDGLPCAPLMGSCGTAAHERRPVFVSDIANDPHWEHFRELAAEHGIAACCSMPVFSLGGEVLGTVAMYYPQPHDPGELDRHLIERAKRLAAIIIERKQAEAALAEQTEELLRSDRSKDEFLAMLAHELRNPLAPIRHATEILHSAAAGPAEVERARQLIARQTENMSRMIDDLLDVSRINQGKIELRTRIVELQGVLSAAAEVARQSCEIHGQTLTVSLPDEAVYLDADATRLEQLFGNLLGNACKYSGPGSHIRLSAEVVNRQEAVIRIADDGIGIDPELMPRIFDLFVQSSRSLDRSHGGLGIGLTVAERLVRLHRGVIEASSEGLGKGCEFVVRLPLAEAAPDRPEPAASGPAVTRSLRMLIVDDNEDAASSMALLQELRGHVTRTAANGTDALKIAADFVPQVVLLDIGLPGMDGFEVARRLRELPAMKSSFLIALTGYGSQSDRQRAKEAGFNEHLVKPADMNLLGGWLDRVPPGE
jgi:PAS domain S-box-containing protein